MPVPTSVHDGHSVTHSEVGVIAGAIFVVGPGHEEDELVGEGYCVHSQSASIANHLPATVSACTACKAPMVSVPRFDRDLSEALVFSLRESPGLPLPV